MARKKRRVAAARLAGPAKTLPRVETALPRKASIVEAGNLGVRFALEMGALLVIGIAGFEATESVLRWVLALGGPAIAALVWGAFVSPKAPHRLQDPARVVLEVAYFGVATAAIVSLGNASSALLFAIVASLSLELMFMLKQRGL